MDVDVLDTEGVPDPARAIRRRVFVDEQGVPPSAEMDGRDGEAVHALARVDDSPVGTARLRVLADRAKAERVAVLPAHRRSGVGRALMDALEAAARERGASVVVLHAQTSVEEFYHRLGYETASDVFEEAGMPHVEMRKRLE